MIFKEKSESPAPCADKRGHGKAITSVCDARSGARGEKKRNIATVKIVAPSTVKRKRNSWVWKVMQQFEPPMPLGNVPCGVRWRSLNMVVLLLSVFLDPRRKMMSEDDCIGGGNALQTMAISDIEELGHRFVGNVAHSSSRTPARAPAPALAPASAPAPAPGLATSVVNLTYMSSVMEQRCLARLAAAGHGSSSHGTQGGVYNL